MVFAAEPEVFQPNPNSSAASMGGGGADFKDSPHFRVYGAGTSADTSLKWLEGAYQCFVKELGWRTSGLSRYAKDDKGPYYKENIYARAQLTGASGVMNTDERSGYSWVQAVRGSVAQPQVVVHEYGHALTYHENNWVDQGNTGAYWEPLANWFADTYLTSPLCAAARANYSQAEGRSIIDLRKVIGQSYRVLVDGTPNNGNYYEAWPFMTYLTNNPDNYAGLGKDTMRDWIRKYKVRSNETPLHALQTVAGATKVSKIMGRYWARMAYVDIGHKSANAMFTQQRKTLQYGNVDAAGDGSYKVKAARAPRYYGASIIPLKGTGQITVAVKAPSEFVATLAIKSGSSVKYVDLEAGSGSATVGAGEEATLVVANTPEKLIKFDPFKIPAEVAKGLDFTVKITGATA
ncbi:hypothetical protein BT63DRAFT_458867 [Microthyrium microscopicum]|uniref:Dockerin type 1 n=1 Tax=Microthyrium microscopicum TaxID=703497 RepID=A0A6A6U019_9PEZI|nr:hypothetical protein BT63DRAFT_458867 [Microthyrium microscopicum]